MNKICILLIVFLSPQTFAKTSNDCQDLKSEQIRLALTASNLANVNTTRTPEGGVYQPYIVKSCINGGCDARRDNKAPVLKYLPHHPDADKNGYVAFPYIDEKSEYATLNATVTKLKLLASAKACHATVLVDNGDSSFIIRYNGRGQSDIKEDVFNLNRDHQVVSWMRQDTQGRATTVNFALSDQMTSHSQIE